MSKPKFKFTLDDLNTMVVEALKQQTEKPNTQQTKPNLLQMLRAKKENKETKWPLA